MSNQNQNQNQHQSTFADISQSLSQTNSKLQKTSPIYFICFVLAIILGVFNGINPSELGNVVANSLSEVFIRLFKFVSVPIIGLAICLTIVKLGSDKSQQQLWKRTLSYTLSTTILAAATAAVLYYILQPENIVLDNFDDGKISENSQIAEQLNSVMQGKDSYLNYFISVIPDNLLKPFINGNVLSVLLLALVVAFGIRQISNVAQREAITNVLEALQSVLYFVISWIIKLLPLGIFAFVSQSVAEFSKGVELGGLATYFSIIVASNTIQFVIILPLFLLFRKLNPLQVFSQMFKAVAVAFCTKSSAATLPVTLSCAENNLQADKKVANFVLPICTTINMNGCAAFILTTVVYLMQNNGVVISPEILLGWIFIATIAAVGNAGVPMGCFFLSASLLSSMNVPIILLGVILPVYALLDMIETGLNVWSDSCVCAMVDKDLKTS